MRNRRYRMIVLGAAAVGVALAIASFNARPAFVWNGSASAPVGLWRVLDRPWRVGDWVAVRPTPKIAALLKDLGVTAPDRLLVKQVTAGAGDQVCREGDRVFVNGRYRAEARRRTSTGVALPSWEGCRRLDAGEAFLLNPAPGSLDGRYFGAIEGEAIVGPIAFVGGEKTR